MNSAGLESSKEQRQEIDTKEKAALPAGDGNGIYLQTKAPFPVHSLLSTPETQMWMKKGIMLERQLGKGVGGGGGGREKGWRKRREEGEGKQNPNRLHFQEVQPWKKEGEGLPASRSLSKSVCLFL